MVWRDNVGEIKSVLEAVEVTDKKGMKIETDKAFDLWVEMALGTKERQKTIYLIGNGASASMASHIATDLLKNGNIKAMVFTDPSLITALSNDISFKDAFSKPLKRFATEGDMLIGISSSGRSPNILEAVSTMRSLGGIVITLSAMDMDNPLRNSGDLNLYIPAKGYGMAETGHAAILHYWIDRIIERIH